MKDFKFRAKLVQISRCSIIPKSTRSILKHSFEINDLFRRGMLEHFTAVFHFLQKHFNAKELLDDLKIISGKMNLKCSPGKERSLGFYHMHLSVI